MAYTPDIVNYKPFWIQFDSVPMAWDTRQWGLVANTNPFPILPNPKAPYVNKWHDENGEEEYTDNLHYEAYEFEVTFYKKCFDTEEESADAIMRKELDTFFSNIKSKEFLIFDSYTGIGRRKVRYAGFSEESYKRRSGKNGWAVAIFKIKFKVNDPVTRIVKVNQKLMEE